MVEIIVLIANNPDICQETVPKSEKWPVITVTKKAIYPETVPQVEVAEDVDEEAVAAVSEDILFL